MNKDKRKVLFISLVTFAVLIAVLFINVSNSKIITAAVLVIFALLTFFAIRRRSALSINKRSVLMLMAVIAVLYVVIKEITGLYFQFYKNPYYVNSERLINTIIPTALIIISVEVIRYVMLAQKMKLVSVITYLSCVLSEVLICSNIAGIYSFNRFMDVVGLALFPAISANVFYHYVSKNYGMFPNIVFRLITTLYVYFIPVTSGISDALDSCVKIILPIALLAFVSAMFEKKQKKAIEKGKKLGFVGILLSVVVFTSVVMLISCQFRFGALVIATESMTGEINKGDMIIYEQYEDQKIKEGQVIVFMMSDVKVVHRVYRIDNIDGEMRYYTKGDANESPDIGYRLESDIVGLTDFKIAYLGYPTLLLREMIQN